VRIQQTANVFQILRFLGEMGSYKSSTRMSSEDTVALGQDLLFAEVGLVKTPFGMTTQCTLLAK